MSFTSDLSIDEILLIEEAGFEPVELVWSSAWYHIGFTYAAWNTNAEIPPLTAVMLAARHDAMNGLQQQVERVRADGIVGVRLEVEREGHHAHFSAMGTAVRHRSGHGGAWRDARGAPFTCDLSGRDFWALVRGGFRPVGLVMGVCVYHIAHQGLRAWFAQTGRNVEQPQFTQGLYDARELAMGRMQAEAQSFGGAGVVGVTTEEGSHGWHDHVIEFRAVGTAIVPITDATHATHAPPAAVISARDT